MLDNNTLKNTLIWFVFFVRERKQINIWKSLRQYVYSFYADLVWASVNTSLWMWIMRSPPGKYSMMKQTWSLVWKQPWRLTRNGCLDALIISKILFSLIRLQKKIHHSAIILRAAKSEFFLSSSVITSMAAVPLMTTWGWLQKEVNSPWLQCLNVQLYSIKKHD